MSTVTDTSDIAATGVLVDAISDVSVYNGHFPVYPMIPYITVTLFLRERPSVRARTCMCARANLRAFVSFSVYNLISVTF